MIPHSKVQDGQQTTSSITMQIAAILSDLTSLRVCDHSAALALVSTRPPPPSAHATSLDPKSAPSDTPTQSLSSPPPPRPTTDPTSPTDPELTRAHTLLHLHQTVKLAYTTPSSSSSSLNRTGPASASASLSAARQSVARALALLEAGEEPNTNSNYQEHAGPNPSVDEANVGIDAAAADHDEDEEEVNAWS